MGWKVRLADGSFSEPFETHADAAEFVSDLEAQDTRPPEEIYAATTRPHVSRETFLRRKRMGWATHRALHTSLSGQYIGMMRNTVAYLDTLVGGRNAEYHVVMGRSRTVGQWAASCGYPEESLRAGIARYGSLAAYFEYAGWYPTKPALPGDPEVFDDKWTTPAR